ncbi:hypothetical protein QYF36_017915 [Acer negundo]|nr:hypothetical protein QYF36_017915 [Acer negundo]
MILFDFIKPRIIAQSSGNERKLLVVHNQVTTNYKLLRDGGGIMSILEFINHEGKHHSAYFYYNEDF